MLISKVAYEEELAGFNLRGSVALSCEDVSVGAVVPNEWIDLLSSTGDGKLVDLWGPLLIRLPSVRSFFAKNLRAPAIFSKSSDDSVLLYPYTVDGGEDLNFFIGNPPLGDLAAENETQLWRALPDDLQYFYRNIHNGWTFFPTNSMGPLPIGDFGLLSEFDLEPEDLRKMTVSPQQILRVFHNGSGDYLCLDLANSQGDGATAGILWSHENAGELERVDFWGVMDAWIGIFLEEADGRE
ncbi:MAG TPA: SMI1/KNR4 family protein [Micrococcaceae bacterium]|nr:SMI1/KNR4 family protein [Micrococcaceae bacterium]